MQKEEQNLTYTYPDIILYSCPFECNDKICEQEWMNKQLGNKIICKCKKCDHKKGETTSDWGVLENNDLSKNQSLFR